MGPLIASPVSKNYKTKAIRKTKSKQHCKPNRILYKGRLNLVHRSFGLIDFGKQKSSQLAKLLGKAPQSGMNAHHLIPWSKGKTHDLVQMAAGLLPPFHLNYKTNGKWIAKIRNTAAWSKKPSSI